jgi:hypothetical protein
MPPERFEPTISEGKRPQTYALDRATTGTGNLKLLVIQISQFNFDFTPTIRIDSSVDVATGYGLDGLGIESRWGRDFPHLSKPALGLNQPTVQWVPGLSREQGAAGVLS